MLAKAIETIAIFCVAVFVILLVFVCIFTPEKTKNGEYTNPYKYWTSDTYLCKNFNCKK